ncbi:hypothetical protein F4860DRAFT_494820 [Xylaria cubensis]|nr:hypothetical protein F4860DRAFT_494820 [Xylaria cubensis]
MSANDMVVFTWAERYCATLSAEFTSPARLSVETLNELTDDWIQNAVQEIPSAEAMALACMLGVSYLNEDWILANFESVFWIMGFESVTGRLTLFKYLLSRYERYVVDHPAAFTGEESESQYSDVDDSGYESGDVAMSL